MQLNIKGLIDRRILVNYRLDPRALSRVLPAPFRPKLVGQYAIGGICMIRLKQIRPAFLPAAVGMYSENAAHRFAVEWEQDGRTREGVFIPRRDTNSRFNTVVGGRLLPGVHDLARFDVQETDDELQVGYRSVDGQVRVRVHARVSDELPRTSAFKSLAEASQFFEAGSLGYSATSDPARFDALELRCRHWSVQALAVQSVYSSYFEDSTIFPEGAAKFDCALLMRGIQHEWRAREAMVTRG